MTGSPTALSRAIDAHGARPYVPDVRNPRLTQDDAYMLDRLRASKSAQSAFAYLRLDEAKWPIFIGDCVVAHRYANGMHTEEVEIFRSAPKAEKAREALAEVGRFFRGSIFETIRNPPSVPEVPKTWEEFANSQTYIRGPDPGPIGEAIALLTRAINDEERLRKEYSPSQKGGAEAARARALAHLRESVSRLTGVPNQKLIAVLAEVVLGLKDGTISVDDVKNAKTPSKVLASRRNTTPLP
jgi:hypothetical protein